MIIWIIDMEMNLPIQMFHFAKKKEGYIITLPPPITYDYVDLGLPSGTKWATKNVGARKPSDAGFYFQWGDTKGYTANQVGTGEGQKKFAADESDYKWNRSDDGLTFTKYPNFGDNLDLEDDAAHVNMGGDWHIPSKAQCQELINNTLATKGYFDKDNYGILFISKNDSKKLIFMPLSGGAFDGSVLGSGNLVGVWSSTSSNANAFGLGAYSDSSTPIVDAMGRVNGLPIRGVIG